MAKKSSGGNLKLPSPSQAQTVKPMKDKMARNVGGRDHLGGSMSAGPGKAQMTGGARGGKSAPRKLKG